MTKGRRRSGLSTSRTTQQTSSCKPTGDSASISGLPIQCCTPTKEDQQRHQAIKERHICRT
ncbi:hypothetical protein DPMN_031290 [Dreissena polymorpha]|uniref:Uncharacterized protein n=1 Tax=Dreissena polymorpha TaxID=45954 RepID=A0A9D4M1M0_DREPO|nr:hypothetical protein DPMN_031290 [Dreissena polymorpha]